MNFFETHPKLTMTLIFIGFLIGGNAEAAVLGALL